MAPTDRRVRESPMEINLKDVWMPLPTLWLQETRDDLADLKLIKQIVKKYES